MAEKQTPPGLTFHIQEKSLNPPALPEHAAIGYISMTATVRDLAVWDEVVQRIDGMEIFTVKDVASTLVDVAKRRADRAEKQAMQINEESRQEIDRLNAELSFKNQQIASLEQQLLQAQQERDQAVQAHQALEEYAIMTERK